MLGKVNVILDAAYGSSGKGKLSAFLADTYEYSVVSSANFPNAGHTAVVGDKKFIAKALPTALILNTDHDNDLEHYMHALVTPGSGFAWEQLAKEWQETGCPPVTIHDRCCIVTPNHAARERSGKESTAHIASTMQGTAAALADKIQRRPDAFLAGSYDLEEVATELEKAGVIVSADMFWRHVKVVPSQHFRNIVHEYLQNQDILHEGSQGYALSIDHGSHYPHCTSRNCTTSAALDYLGVAPQRLGDVWLNLRTYPIRVGSITEGSSGDVYGDSEELAWADVAARAGMPYEETLRLTERERTTVTKRVRRVFTFSWENLRDACRTNGATKLCLNFAQYLNWQDAGKTEFDDLSHVTHEFIRKIEDEVNLPVVLVGTGAKHSEICVREEYL